MKKPKEDKRCYQMSLLMKWKGLGIYEREKLNEAMTEGGETGSEGLMEILDGKGLDGIQQFRLR